MEFKGTKGEWYINRFGNVVSENEEVAYMPSLTEKEHKKANALLISKAPEMLKMLEYLSKHIVNESSVNDKIKNLIKEATELNAN